MPRKYIYLLLAIVAAIVIYGVVRKQQTRYTANAEPTLQADSLQPMLHDTNTYAGLREMALNVTAKTAGITTEQGLPFGVVMDWGMDDATVTVVALADGNASLYVSTGASVIGGGDHPEVHAAAVEAVRTASAFLPQMPKVNETPLPSRDELRVYALTSHGKYLAQSSMDEIEKGTTRYLGLFNSMQTVLAELRKTTGE